MGSTKPLDISVIFSEFSYSWTCVIIMGVMMGMTAIRNLSVFVTINTYGVIFILMILAFIVGVGIYSFTNTTFSFVEPKPDEDVPWIKLFSRGYGPLMGMLGGGYYLHNITLPIIRNAKNPEKNARDVFLGYFMVFLSYAVCGVMGYFGFSGHYFRDELGEKEIKNNCLLMLPAGNILATVIRFCTFCQILAALCLMFAVQRRQIFLVLFGNSVEKAENQPMRTVILANVAILIAPFILSIFYPQVGKLAGVLGSFSAISCVYILPTITYLKDREHYVLNPMLSEAIKNNRFTLKDAQDLSTMSASDKSPQI
jgi:amino acid transporter